MNHTQKFQKQAVRVTMACARQGSGECNNSKTKAINQVWGENTGLCI